MKRFVAIIAACLALTACSRTDTETATRALEGAGYKNIFFTGYQWNGCGDNEGNHTGFRAIGPTGMPVEGVVCSSAGWGRKAATIRTY